MGWDINGNWKNITKGLSRGTKPAAKIGEALKTKRKIAKSGMGALGNYYKKLKDMK